MLFEIDRHHLLVGFLFGQSFFHQRLDLYPGRKGRNGRLDIFVQHTVLGEVQVVDISHDSGLRIAVHVLFQIAGNKDDRIDRTLLHHPFALVHTGNPVGHLRRRRSVDHPDELTRQRRIVLIEHGYRHVVRHSAAEQHDEEQERQDRQPHRKPVKDLVVAERPDFPDKYPPECSDIFHFFRNLKPHLRRTETRTAAGNPSLRQPLIYRISSQFTVTVIPGRKPSTLATGRALTSNVRISKSPLVRVADQVAYSACTAI